MGLKTAAAENLWGEHARREREFYEKQYSAAPDDAAARLTEPLSVREVYALDLLGDCRERIVLELGSGTGRHAVEIGRRGGRALATDVTATAMRQTHALALAAGQADQVRAASMDAHALALADASVDLIFGAQVLHHLDPRQTGAEMGRVLRPGGRAVFIENSSRNPVLMWARRHLMGRCGIRRFGSANESPLDDAAIAVICQQMGGSVRVHFPQLCLTVLLARHWLASPWAMRFFLQVDRQLERWLPALRPWSFLQVLEFQKASAARTAAANEKDS